MLTGTLLVTPERRGVSQHRLAAPVEVILMVVSDQRVVNERRGGTGWEEEW